MKRIKWRLSMAIILFSLLSGCSFEAFGGAELSKEEHFYVDTMIVFNDDMDSFHESFYASLENEENQHPIDELDTLQAEELADIIAFEIYMKEKVPVRFADHYTIALESRYALHAACFSYLEALINQDDEQTSTAVKRMEDAEKLIGEAREKFEKETK
ncbi:hypothetical protein [Shouchella patagoniensis]|uniref:hypothetical protein n=1 Tax=Shouchella patagoniensis TaxID=228576 RepID=UPI00111726CD|nr:hypothetical protein [Shouchella patagoniensis]